HERTAVQVLETLNVPLLGRPQPLEQVDERALRVVAGGEGATDGSDLHRSPKSGRMVRVLICRLVAQLLPIGRPDAPSYPRAHSTYHDRVPAAWECALAGSDVAAASDGVSSWSIDRRGVRNRGRWSRMRLGSRVNVASALVAIMRAT